MKYNSKYSSTQVTAAQYITEIICEHKAVKEQKELYYKFWNNKEWSRFFRNQIATANKLIEKYGDKPVIRALNDNKARRIFSLRAPHLIEIIEQKAAEVKRENQTLTKKLVRTDDQTFRQNKKKTNILDTLEDIDNDKD